VNGCPRLCQGSQPIPSFWTTMHIRLFKKVLKTFYGVLSDKKIFINLLSIYTSSCAGRIVINKFFRYVFIPCSNRNLKLSVFLNQSLRSNIYSIVRTAPTIPQPSIWTIFVSFRVTHPLNSTGFGCCFTVLRKSIK
jgi:hypothetical protein